MGGILGAGAHGSVVEPTRVAAARSGHVVAVVGWPTGRHESVVKAAEARLAVERGAGEIWLAPDPDADESAMLADAIAVHQGVSVPFGVIFCGPASVAAAEHSGADVLAVPDGVEVPATRLSVAVFGGGASLRPGVARAFPAAAAQS